MWEAVCEVCGSIEGVKDPEPLGGQRLAFSQLLRRSLLAEQSPTGIGECSPQPIQQPLIHSQISCRHRTFPAIIHTQSPGKSVGGLLTTGIGPEDVSSPPAKWTESFKKLLMTDTGRKAWDGRHHGEGLVDPL